MTVPASSLVADAEYLALSDAGPQRWELVDGHLVEVMSGTARHDVLLNEVNFQLSRALREGPCRVYPHDRRLKVGRNYRQPDLLIACGPVEDEQFESDADHLVEVLSPGTARVDLADKVIEYKALPSVRQYLVLDPDTGHVLLYERHDLGWHVDEPTGSVRLAGVDLDLAALYAFVDGKLSR